MREKRRKRGRRERERAIGGPEETRERRGGGGRGGNPRIVGISIHPNIRFQSEYGLRIHRDIRLCRVMLCNGTLFPLSLSPPCYPLTPAPLLCPADVNSIIGRFRRVKRVHACISDTLRIYTSISERDVLVRRAIATFLQHGKWISE